MPRGKRLKNDIWTFANTQNRSMGMRYNNHWSSIVKRKARGDSLDQKIIDNFLQLLKKDHDKQIDRTCLRLGYNLGQM